MGSYCSSRGLTSKTLFMGIYPHKHCPKHKHYPPHHFHPLHKHYLLPHNRYLLHKHYPRFNCSSMTTSKETAHISWTCATQKHSLHCRLPLPKMCSSKKLNLSWPSLNLGSNPTLPYPTYPPNSTIPFLPYSTLPSSFSPYPLSSLPTFFLLSFLRLDGA